MNRNEKRTMERQVVEREIISAIKPGSMKYEKSMTDTELYTACLSVIERAAELYADIYDVEREELISEANVAFCRILPKVRCKTDSEAKKWIGRVIVSAMFNYCTKHQLETEVLDVSLMYDDRELMKSVQSVDITKALSTLNVEERKIMRLYMSGYEVKDISRHFGIPEYRALVKLMRALGKASWYLSEYKELGWCVS